MQNYADINLIPIIKRVPGVGDASAFGQRIYSMRIWLKPDVMATYGLVPNDVSAALAEQNIEAAPGQFGEQGGQSFQYTMKYTGRLKNANEFGNMIIRASQNGQILRLSDIARVELGSVSYGSSSTTNGKPSVGVAISQTAGSNAQDVIKGSLQVLQDASKTFPKGINYVSLFNINDFLSASISKVIHYFDRSVHSCIYCCVSVSAGFQIYLNSRNCSAGGYYWHIFLFEFIWIHN